jgi:hypothetical protein
MDPNEGDEVRRTRITTLQLDEIQDLGALQERKRRAAQRQSYQASSKGRNQQSTNGSFAVDNNEFVGQNIEPESFFRQFLLQSYKETSIGQGKFDSQKSISHINSHSGLVGIFALH